MAITNIDPNNFDETFDAYYKSLPTGSIPGMTVPAINFRDAPVNFMMRKNNPALPFYKEPATNIKNIVQDFPGSIKSGIGKGFDLGKAAFGGIASLVTGIPGIGLLLNAFGPMSPEEKAMRDFYGSEFGLTDTGQVASGIMKGYNPVSLTGFGLSGAIDKRIARIQKTLQKKKSDTLQKRLKELQDLKAKEAAAASKQLESQRRGRRPGTGGSGPPGTGGVKDSGGSTGGYSYDSGGRKGFGYGLKNGGLVSLL